MSLQHDPIYYDIAYSTRVIEAGNTSEMLVTEGAPYLALMGKLWAVYCTDLGTNGRRNNGTALHDDVIKWKQSPVPGEFPAQRPVTRGFDVLFHLLPNKRLRKQSWGWWFETPFRPLWRHRNDIWHATYNSQPVVRIHGIVCPSAIHFMKSTTPCQRKHSRWFVCIDFVMTDNPIGKRNHLYVTLHKLSRQAFIWINVGLFYWAFNTLIKAETKRLPFHKRYFQRHF